MDLTKAITVSVYCLFIGLISQLEECVLTVALDPQVCPANRHEQEISEIPGYRGI